MGRRSPIITTRRCRPCHPKRGSWTGRTFQVLFAEDLPVERGIAVLTVTSIFRFFRGVNAETLSRRAPPWLALYRGRYQGDPRPSATVGATEWSGTRGVE